VAEAGTGGAAAYSIVVPRGFVRAETPPERGAATAGDVDPAAWRDFQQMRARLSELDSPGELEAFVLDAFVTAGRVPGIGATASLVVTIVPTVPSPAADLDALLLARVARGGRPLVVGHESAVAWDSVSGQDAPVGDENVMRRRTVLARVAGSDHLLASFTLTLISPHASPDLGSAPSPGPHGPDSETEAVADALVELFDAMMTTVRWLDEQGRVITDRPTT